MQFRIVRSVGQAVGFALVFAALTTPAWATGTTTGGVPEMDAGTMGSALTLFLGGLLMLRSRYRRR